LVGLPAWGGGKRKGEKDTLVQLSKEGSGELKSKNKSPKGEGGRVHPATYAGGGLTTPASTQKRKTTKFLFKM